MDTEPRTPMERKVRDDVRSLRESEEKQALSGIRQGYREARRATMGRMDAYRDRVVNRANRMLSQKHKEIARDERKEEQSSDLSESHPHEKNHGMDAFRRELVDMIASERKKERQHVQEDMSRGDAIDYRRAKEGMRDNQEKDESQIVRLARQLTEKKQKSWFGNATYPEESGALLKAEMDNDRGRKTFKVVRIEIPRKKNDIKDFADRSRHELEQHPIFEELRNHVTDKKLGHIANVSSLMSLLSPRMGLDPRAAWLAGSLHDMFDESSLRQHGNKESRKANPRWFWMTGHDHHGPLAAAHAASTQILGPEWTDAIRHHSTGTHQMSPHMKIMLLSDTISPDRGKSDELKKLRQTSETDPNEAVRMIINALHHSILRGHGQNKLRDGLNYDPFRPRTSMLRMYRMHDPDGKPTGKHPDSMATMAGVLPQNIESPFGMGFRSAVDLDNVAVRHVIGSAFDQIDNAEDKDKPEIFATWLTARNRGGALFRNILPGIWPLVSHRYASLIPDAEKRSDGQTDVTLPDIAAVSKLIGSGSSENLRHLHRYFHPDWVDGKPKVRMFIRVRHMNFVPHHMPSREMHKSMGNIETLLPEPLRIYRTDWHIGDRF